MSLGVVLASRANTALEALADPRAVRGARLPRRLRECPRERPRLGEALFFP